jgi:hypothetical protein
MAPIRQSPEFKDHVRKLFEGYGTADPAFGRGVIRATTRLVADCRSEGQFEEHLVISDEPKERGGTGQGPSPLQYFLAALGF